MDIGIPITAMHSCRELMGAADQESLVRLIRAFFSHNSFLFYTLYTSLCFYQYFS